MQVKQLLYKGIAVLSFVAITFTGLAQQLISEPAGGMDESELEEAVLGLPASTISTPDIMDIYPLNRFYNSWDTMYVRRYAELPPTVEGKVVLPLFNEHSSGFVFPIEGEFLSPFGYRGRRIHSGVDIRVNAGDPIAVAFDGVVRMAKYYSSYGNCVVVRHYNGLETLYSHLSKIKVRANQLVKAGDIIGLGGRTGRATCNHLHFETRFQGKAFNPKQLIDFNTFSLISDTLQISKSTFGFTRDYMPSVITEATAVSDSLALDKSSDDAVKTKTIASAPKVKKKFHTIKSGETLSSISRKHGTTVKQVCSLNGIKASKKLKPGTRLRVK